MRQSWKNIQYYCQLLHSITQSLTVLYTFSCCMLMLWSLTSNLSSIKFWFSGFKFLVLKFASVLIVWLVSKIAVMLKIIISIVHKSPVLNTRTKFQKIDIQKLFNIKLVHDMLFLVSKQHNNNVLWYLSGQEILSTLARFLNMFSCHVALCGVSCKIATRQIHRD